MNLLRLLLNDLMPYQSMMCIIKHPNRDGNPFG
nr:MAG TPA: hypothetical protein [Myoviridae sp. ctTS62]